MALKLPPALIFLLFTGLMYLLCIYLPFGYFDFLGRFVLVKILIIAAIFIALIAMFQFYRSKTTIDPREPSKAKLLVTNGVYNYSRNPMYLALLLLLLAWGLWLGNAFNVLLAAAFVAFMNRFQIGPEEAALRDLFGKEYDQYIIRVRRWF
ncbi:MAG: methyltransferase family protein [Flavobacteriaceae bacterium]